MSTSLLSLLKVTRGFSNWKDGIICFRNTRIVLHIRKQLKS